MDGKRQKVQTLILETIKLLDPSGYNTSVYVEFFGSLNDTEFDKWMHVLKENQHGKLTLLVPPLKVVLSTEAALAAAKYLKLELFERIKLWDPVGKRYCITPEKYLVLRLPVRRLKQYIQSGLSVPDSDRRLNPLTDQVVKPDKGSAISFPQAQMIAEKGLTTTLHELMTIRGGDIEAYSKMRAEIEEGGDSDSSVMQGTQGVKSVKTLRNFFNAMHLDTNL